MRRLPELGRYLARRLVVLVPLLFGVTLITFLIIRVGDANPAVLIAGPNAGPDTVAAIEEELRLNDPLLTQYWDYVGGAVRGDLGESWLSNQSVRDELWNRLPATIELVTYGILWSVVVGLVLGFVAARYRNGIVDHVTRVGTLGGISMPIFWVGLLLLFVFSFQLGWTPGPLGRLGLLDVAPPRVTGAYTIDALLAGDLATFRSAALHLVLPVATIVAVTGAAIAKQARASIVEVLDSESVRYARAMGFPERTIWRMAMQVAVPTVLTFVAITYGLTLGGSALVELIFSWGGMGQFGINAITRVDFAVVQGYVLALALISVLVYLASDLVIAYLDPRVRL